MYIHLQLQQEQNESSIRRQRRAAQFSVETKTEALSILGDCGDDEYPIYMQGNQFALCGTTYKLHLGRLFYCFLKQLFS
ncbi:hypothetical protein MA16_Dca029068 [Dendrobium catenatum]|uniref:Uncharacterized protein n=1 Tax=Dendrobium catenatum TaxID=906689 RepID=A0A2I0VE85_9ASPA|nr:hypothetical protein MA16_Dca029068 [Dendrobium catenatum]